MNPFNSIRLILFTIFLVVIISTFVILPYVFGQDIITPDNTGLPTNNTHNNKTVVTEHLNICAQYDPDHCDIVPQNTKIHINDLPQTPIYLRIDN